MLTLRSFKNFPNCRTKRRNKQGYNNMAAEGKPLRFIKTILEIIGMASLNHSKFFL